MATNTFRQNFRETRRPPPIGAGSPLHWSVCHLWLGCCLASALLTATAVIYDEFSLAGHWVGKNVCNILGYTSFEIGATKVMGQLI